MCHFSTPSRPGTNDHEQHAYQQPPSGRTFPLTRPSVSEPCASPQTTLISTFSVGCALYSQPDSAISAGSCRQRRDMRRTAQLRQRDSRSDFSRPPFLVRSLDELVLLRQVDPAARGCRRCISVSSSASKRKDASGARSRNVQLKSERVLLAWSVNGHLAVLYVAQKGRDQVIQVRLF